jgi:hypothetical protein
VPLRDLAVNTAELQEEWIEEIITPYVNYDVESKRIVLLPATTSLPARAKILVYLVALRGWPFVTEDEVPSSAKPAQIGEDLGIQGGSLRPVLKNLKDSRYVAVNTQGYSVSLPALPSIKEEIERSANRTRGSGGATSSKRRTSARKPGKASNGGQPAAKRSGKNAEFFHRQIAEGFFDEPKILGDVVERFHENGLTVHRGTVSPLLIKAVRSEELRRKKSKFKGRDVWAYESVK